MYAENLSFALILFAILRAISIGIKLLAPDMQKKFSSEMCSKKRKGVNDCRMFFRKKHCALYYIEEHKAKIDTHYLPKSLFESQLNEEPMKY